MGDVPVQVVIAAFQDERGADDALAQLKEAKRERLIGIQDAAVLRKDENGKLHIKETADMETGKGLAIGGVGGAIVGAIAGAALAGPALVGALVGGLAAGLSDSGFDNKRLQRVGESLTPGSSAIVAVVEHKWVDEVKAMMAEVAAETITDEVSAEVAAQLEAGHDAQYTALLTNEGIITDAQATDGESVAGFRTVLSRDEAAGIEYVATEEGIVAQAIDVTADGVAEGVAAAVVEDEPATNE